MLDHDVYGTTARFLRDLGHDVVQVAQIGLARADDTVLLATAQVQQRIFVTRDRDFGALETYTEDALMQAFVVIEPGGHRHRRLPGR